MNEKYHQQVKEIIQKVFDTQQESIIKACDLGYESVRQGKKFFVLGTGHSHMMSEEFFARLGGTDFFTPIILPEFMLHQFPGKSTAVERLASYADVVLSMYLMEPNDTLMLVSNSGRNGLLVELALRAKKAGVRVITCVNERQAHVVSSRHASGKNMIDFADVIIDNCGVYGDACHEIANKVMIGSTSNIITIMIAQMMNAIMINKREGNKETQEELLIRFRSYFETCFDRTVTQKDAVRQAAEMFYKALAGEHRVFLFGTGHSHLITEELYSRAGGFSCFSPILEDEIMVHQSADKSSQMETSAEYARILFRKYDLKRNDVLLMTSNSGKGNMSVELASIAKSAGVKIVALTNARQSKESVSNHRSGKRLFELADVLIDNCTEIGDAAFLINGHKCCPLSSVLGCYLAQAISVDLAYVMIENDMIPPILLSANIEETATEEQKKIREASTQAKQKYRNNFIYQGPRVSRYK